MRLRSHGRLRSARQLQTIDRQTDAGHKTTRAGYAGAGGLANTHWAGG